MQQWLQQQAVQEAIARVIGSPEAMEKVVEARAAQIVNERVGLGELNTEQISQLTARAQETESALLTARNTQAEQRQELQRVQVLVLVFTKTTMRHSLHLTSLW